MLRCLTAFLIICLSTACGVSAPQSLVTPPTSLPTVISPAVLTPEKAEPSIPSPAITQPSKAQPPEAQPPLPNAAYDIGQPALTDLYVSPTGSDTNDGTSPDTPFQTITMAWEQIPASAPLAGKGFRINLLPGQYPCEPINPDDCQNYFSDRVGTLSSPVILRAYQGAGTVTILGGLNISHVAYLYLIDLRLLGGSPNPTNNSGNNLLHLANVDHVLLRGMTLDGPDCANDTCNNLQEVLKVNQAQYLYIENSTIGGAWHTSVDYFSVQYGHILNSRLHTAGQWCMYLKGGSAYLRIDGSELDHCQLGFQAGQASNLAVMQSPWLHYEAYDIKFVNNLLHDLPGVPLSISGGYNILFAYNTLYRVGTATDPGYPLLQSVPGERGCSATDEIPDPIPVCHQLVTLGAWGPDNGVETESTPAIPNRNIYIYNNLIYNPAPDQTLYAHLFIAGPVDLAPGFGNLPTSIPTDQNLRIAGNLIWNGPADHPLGLDDPTGCAPANPTCNETQLAAENTINRVEPQLANPSLGDYHLSSTWNQPGVVLYPIPDFTWDAFSPAVPSGDQSNSVLLDRDGQPRTEASPPGAYAARE